MRVESEERPMKERAKEKSIWYAAKRLDIQRKHARTFHSIVTHLIYPRISGLVDSPLDNL